MVTAIWSNRVFRIDLHISRRFDLRGRYVGVSMPEMRELIKVYYWNPRVATGDIMSNQPDFSL